MDSRSSDLVLLPAFLPALVSVFDEHLISIYGFATAIAHYKAMWLQCLHLECLHLEMCVLDTLS